MQKNMVVEESKYTKESIYELKNIIAKTNEVLNNKNSTKEQIDKQKSMLENAIKSLKPKTTGGSASGSGSSGGGGGASSTPKKLKDKDKKQVKESKEEKMN